MGTRRLNRARTLLVATLVVGSGAISACAPSPNVVAGPGRIADDPLPVGAYPQVVPLDDVERVVVATSAPVVVKEGSGALSVRVPLRSVVSYSAVLRYRFVYFDDSGAEVDRDVWRVITVPGQSAVDITGRTLRSQSSRWRLEIGRQLQDSPIG